MSEAPVIRVEPNANDMHEEQKEKEKLKLNLLLK